MENYLGVKFRCEQRGLSFSYDSRLHRLNYWSWLFSQLGLTPVHSEGAYGNLSYRAVGNAFVITRSGLIPNRTMESENYCLIEGYDRHNSTFYSRGSSLPSSECFLHQALYRQEQEAQAVLHGHSELITAYADELKIPVTSQFYEYGTLELAQSALEIMSMTQRIIILKDHGFVAIGKSVDDAGRLVLGRYRELLGLIRNCSVKEQPQGEENGN